MSKRSRSNAHPEAASSPVTANNAAAAHSNAPKGKLGTMVALLTRPQGARLNELVDATGWQAHSVRGALSGALKRDRRLSVSSEKAAGGRVYRIAGERPA